METGTPDLELARKFAEAVKAEFPDQMLSYNCSPSFNWKKHLDDATIAKFQRELGAMGFTFQFITLAGFHALNYSMFDLAHGYAREGMSAYVELQEKEFASEVPRLHRNQAPARSRHRLLRRPSPLRSTRTHPPWPWWDPPKKASSTNTQLLPRPVGCSPYPHGRRPRSAAARATSAGAQTAEHRRRTCIFLRSE